MNDADLPQQGLMARRRDVLAGAAAVTASAALPGAARAQPKRAITVRVDRDLEQFDPAYRNTPQEGAVIRSVFQRLVRHKPNSGELEMEAAAEINQVSPTVIEFRLKEGIEFTEGYGALTAEDVKFSFERIGREPDPGRAPSPYRGDWARLERVEVTGPLTGRIVTSTPRAGLFQIAIGDVSGAIVSKKAVLERGTKHDSAPVGAGPFVLASLERQRGAVLKANPAYRGTKPGFEEISIRIIPDARATELALRSGELDFAILPPAVAEPLRSVQGLSVDPRPAIQYIFLGLNMENGPLADPRVRRAIRLGLDVDQMLLAGYNGKVPRLNALIPAPILGHWPEAPSYKRDVAQARALLREAGVSNPKFKLLCLNQPAFQNMALVARALLQEVGITVDLDARDPASFWSAGSGEAGKSIELYMTVFNGKLDPNFLTQWFVSEQVGEWNWQRFRSPEFDRLVGEAASELDETKRAALIVSAQRVMDESAAFVWLTNNAAFLAHRSWLRPASVPGWTDWQFEAFAPV